MYGNNKAILCICQTFFGYFWEFMTIIELEYIRVKTIKNTLQTYSILLTFFYKNDIIL